MPPYSFFVKEGSCPNNSGLNSLSNHLLKSMPAIHSPSGLQTPYPIRSKYRKHVSDVVKMARKLSNNKCSTIIHVGITLWHVFLSAFPAVFFFGEACKMAAEESEIVSASEVSNVSNTEESLLAKIQAKFGEEIKTAFESKSVFLTGSVHSTKM